MEAADFANQMSFWPYGLQSTCWQYPRVKAWLARAGQSLEVINTHLPENSRELRRRVEPLLGIPRFSSYAIGALINKAVSSMPEDSIYLNIGVWHGFTLFAGMAGNGDRRSVGVDNFSEFEGSGFGSPRRAFLERFERLRGPSDDFFELDFRDYFSREHDGKQIGLYLYDGSHEYEDQMLGLELADPYLAPGALIIVDDTNAPAPRRATLDFVVSKKHRYAVVADLTTAENCHPTVWNGVMLLRRSR